MTLRQVIECLREAELTEGDDPLDRLVAVTSVLRTCIQGEIATSEGVLASVHKFEEKFGKVSTETVDLFCQLPDGMLDADIPNDYLLEILGSD